MERNVRTGDHFSQVLLAAQYSLLQHGNNRRASWIELREPVETVELHLNEISFLIFHFK